MVMIAITTSNSMSVKAREYFFFIGGISLGSDTVLGLSPERKRKRGQKQDCLTTHWPFCVCRSCQIKSLFHLRLRQVPNPSRSRNPHRLVCLRTWLRRLPVFRSSAASSFTFWKSTTVLCASMRCSRSSLAARGYSLQWFTQLLT